ncbi:MAG: B12-binding domain-containing radical SAM protein [Patescibacteria group bacterium]|nr:B12-binding domain-containing radical SAM protein [Patescibacteria group bacterium]
MNVLLVYPEFPETFWSFKKALEFIGKKAASPPLGLLTIAAMLPKEWNLKLIDLNVNPLLDEDISWADMVFISAMLVQQKSAGEVIERVKKVDKKIVAGGPLFSTQPDLFVVDHVFINEAEDCLSLFLNDLEREETRSLYKSKEKPLVTEVPVPLWSLINFSDYTSIPLQYSRGCPHNCDFCDITVMYGHKVRVKTPTQMIKEFNSLYQANWRGPVFLVDDNFIGNKKQVKIMLRELIKWQKARKYPFKLLTEASVDLASDQELMRLMSQANFHKVFLGIETPHLESLKGCQKYQNTRMDLKEAVKVIHQHGMQVMGGFIVGFDEDPPSIFEAQIQFIQEVGIVTAMVGLLVALPRTKLWHRLKKEGRILENTSGDNTDGSLNFIPRMKREDLINGYKEILSTIYGQPDLYYQRIHAFLKNYQPTHRGRFNFAGLMAFFRSIWRIGILSKSRFLYWKLFFKTLFTKIKCLPVALEMAIYGQHFERVTKRVLNK